MEPDVPGFKVNELTNDRFAAVVDHRNYRLIEKHAPKRR